ncbi:DUF1707 SHOCT-like domain-containing protein [Nocardioides sp. MAHUQ-72]|uniref:DUF1707 SHOCT-like domain-containing protein n=1 Tax=unclassified Nocardioides TaxID=2615069 RepID=UPI003619E1B3
MDLWSSFSHDPRDPACAGLRASDADRGVVQQVLAEAYADGRLDREELDSRSTAAGTARTLGELPPLVADLVAAPSARPAGELARLSGEELQRRAVAEYESDRRDALLAFVGPSLVCVVIWAATNWGEWGFFWPAFVIAGTALNLLRTLVRRPDMIDANRRRLKKKQARELDRKPPETGDEGS